MQAANENCASPMTWSHIELWAGTVTTAFMEGAYGRRPLPAEVDQFRFFIEAVDAVGSRFGLNSSPDYGTAIRLAEAARVGFEIDAPVKDMVVGSH